MTISFAGLRGTGNWGTDERPKNFREGILFRNPNGSAPLTALMSKSRKQSVNDPDYSWWEETLQNLRISINDGSGYSAASTTLTVDAFNLSNNFPGGLALREGDVLLAEVTETASYDEEIMIVSSVTNDTTIVVVRGAAGSTAVGIADGMFMTRIGSVHEEGASLPDLTTKNPTKLNNLCQIFRTVFGATETTNATFARTGDAYKMDKKRKFFDHNNKMEWAFMFGVSSETTGANGLPQRFTAGLRKFITTNVKIYTTSPTEDDFMDTISPIFDFTPETGGVGNERVVLAGNGFLNNLNKVARNSSSTRINQDGTLKIYGMELKKYVLPQGTLGIRTHPLLSTHARFTNSAFFLNFGGLVYRPLRDTKFEDDVEAKGEDSRKGQWITEAGLQVHHETPMAYLGNFVV